MVSGDTAVGFRTNVRELDVALRSPAMAGMITYPMINLPTRTAEVEVIASLERPAAHKQFDVAWRNSPTVLEPLHNHWSC
jgi:hypothetical protein